MKLPRKYLSYSQYSLWQSSPNQYRKQYYEGEKSFYNLEMYFGHQIHTLLEDGNNCIYGKQIKQGDVTEHKIEVVIEGIPLMGYIDSYYSKSGNFREVKTGRTPWDAIKVRKHKQLPFYALMLNTKGDTTCWLDWIETKKVYKKENFGGTLMNSKEYDLEVTGQIQTFERKIEEYEKDKIKKEIIKIANEISADYTQWLDEQSGKPVLL